MSTLSIVVLCFYITVLGCAAYVYNMGEGGGPCAAMVVAALTPMLIGTLKEHRNAQRAKARGFQVIVPKSNRASSKADVS